MSNCNFYFQKPPIIEFKHIKKNLYTDKLLEEKINQAKDQLIKYSKDSRINKNKLKKYIVVYVGRDLRKTIEIQND